MSNFSFYEQVGIVIPGAVFLFGIMFYLPDLQGVFTKDGFSVGGLGIFVIICTPSAIYWQPLVMS